MSAMSIETIWNAVWASSPRSSTALEIVSGCSITSKWLSADPIEVMMPSPTRAMIVSSVAPPISCWRLVRTVTRARILQFDAVPGDGREGRFAAGAVSGQSITFGIDARLHRVEHVAAGQVDGAGPVEVEVEVGPLGGDQRPDHPRHVTAGEVVGLELAGVDVSEARLGGHDLGLDDRAGVDLAQAHAQQFEEGHLGLRPVGLEPELPIVEQQQQHRQGDEAQNDGSRRQRGGRHGCSEG